jgi:hypothetical protein
MDITPREESSELHQSINRQLKRINCEALVFHPEQERVSIQTDDNTTGWPHPIGLENLELVLRSIPDNADAQTVDALFSMYSQGWDQGRQGMLDDPDVREAYYRSQGLPPQLSSLNKDYGVNTDRPTEHDPGLGHG